MEEREIDWGGEENSLAARLNSKEYEAWLWWRREYVKSDRVSLMISQLLAKDNPLGLSPKADTIARMFTVMLDGYIPEGVDLDPDDWVNR